MSTKHHPVTIAAGIATVLALVVTMLNQGVKFYGHLNEIYEYKTESKARDFDIVERLASQNRVATSFYEKALDGSNPDVSPEQAQKHLDDLAFDREQIQKMKHDYVEE